MSQTTTRPRRDADDPDWRDLAFNGMSCRAPGDWSPTRLGLRDMLVEDASGPVMELRFEPARSRFDPQAVFKRLAGRAGRDFRPRGKGDLPVAWRGSLDPEACLAFDWSGPELAATGVLTRCRDCGGVALIQFFRPQGVPAGAVEARAGRVLASFRDHPSDGIRRFALFGLDTRVPEDLVLSRFVFEPGRYELRFKSRGLWLTLFRFAPADVILRGTSLAAWAGPVLGFDPRGAPGRETDAGGLSAVLYAPGAGWPGIMARYAPSRPRLGLAWRPEGKNVVLAAASSANSEAAVNRVIEVCRDHVAL